jgi:hypothetical protein
MLILVNRGFALIATRSTAQRRREVGQRERIEAAYRRPEWENGLLDDGNQLILVDF